MGDVIQDVLGGTTPHIVSANTSPLEALALRALRRYGEMSPSTMEGDVLLDFVDYANEVIDDVLGHPYFPAGEHIDYYVHPSDRRAVPDHIMVSGVLYRHALQQRSQYAPKYEADYHVKLNQLMLRVKFGTAPEFRFQAVDYQDGA